MRIFNINRSGIMSEAEKDAAYIEAGCGHEIYHGEHLFANQSGITLCGECLERRIADMSATQKAALLGYEWTVVGIETE